MMTNDETVLTRPSLGVPASEIPPATCRSRAILVSWLLVIAWMGCIAFFSGDALSLKHTGGILRWLLGHTIGHVDEIWFDRIHLLIRKGAHLGVYLILGLLAFNSWKQSLPSRSAWMFRWALLGLLTVVAAGSVDEWHQSFVPSRTASPVDVGIDTAGGFLAQVMIGAMALVKRRVAD